MHMHIYLFIFTVHNVIFITQVANVWSVKWKINVTLLKIIIIVCVFMQVLHIDPRK